MGTGNLDLAENAFTELLMERFEQDEDAFSIVNQSEIMEAMSGVTNTMSLMIGGIAAISLLVGGIGIMNIMLVSAVLMDDSMSFTMDMKVVWLSVAFSVLIGVLFGLYPANKAASRKPIDALRYSG